MENEITKIKSYKDLQIWQKGTEIVNRVYEITRNMPKDEQFGLINQMRRAAVSIPSNIAEGFARQSFKEYIQFLYIALSSCAELDTQFYIALQQKYILESQHQFVSEQMDHEMRMIRNLIKKIKSND